MDEIGRKKRFWVDINVSEEICAPYEGRQGGSAMKVDIRKLRPLNPRTGRIDEHFKLASDYRRLRKAALCNDVDRVRQHLQAGIDPNIGDKDGRTALHLASAKGYADVVRLLLQHNADCNRRDKVENTPLHLAVCTNSAETVNLLLKAGASIHAEGAERCSPLKLAQCKLRLFNVHNQAFETVKTQAETIVAMMMKLVKKDSEEAELVECFSKKLNVSTNSEQVVGDVKQLLESLDDLHLNKPPLLRPSVLSSSLNQIERFKPEL